MNRSAFELEGGGGASFYLQIMDWQSARRQTDLRSLEIVELVMTIALFFSLHCILSVFQYSEVCLQGFEL